MARLGRLLRGGKIFFVTTNLRRDLSPLTSPERDLLCRCLAAVRKRRRFYFAGFVVMPDHLHLLVQASPSDTISALVQEVKYVSGRKLNRRRSARGPLWQKGFFERYLRTPKEVAETLDYLHHNPVRQALAGKPEEWRWSSASAYRGLAGIIPVDIIELPAQSEKALL